MKKYLALLLSFILAFTFTACHPTDLLPEDLTDLGSIEYNTGLQPDETDAPPLPIDTSLPEDTPPASEDKLWLDPDGCYTTKEDVALYIHLYGELPQNFMTKNEARDLGWEGGGLESYAPGMCIGGDRFGNYEGLLPDALRYTAL